MVDGRLESGIKGLFGAGDEVGGVPWAASPGAFTMGWRAGEMAANDAKGLKALRWRPRGRRRHGRTSMRLNTNETVSIGGRSSWRFKISSTIMPVRCAPGHAGAGIERLKTLRGLVSMRRDTAHTAGRCLEVSPCSTMPTWCSAHLWDERKAGSGPSVFTGPTFRRRTTRISSLSGASSLKAVTIHL